MTAADELERMAEEFRKKRDSHNESAERHKRDPDGLGWQTQHEAVADAWGAAAAQLRVRAAELRAATSGDAGGSDFRVEPVGPPIVNLPAPHAWPAGVAVRISAGLEAALVEVRAGETIEVAPPNPKKPQRVDLKQRWSYPGLGNDLEPEYAGPIHARLADPHGNRMLAEVADMLSNPRWHYHGHVAERPDLGGSEVAGKVGE